jgi:hypothetical protein
MRTPESSLVICSFDISRLSDCSAPPVRSGEGRKVEGKRLSGD